MTQSRSLSEKFPSYWQEACTTENVIQCLSIRERKKERAREWKEIWRRINRKTEEEHIQRTKGDNTKRIKSSYINKTNTTNPHRSTKCIE